jgi:protoheme IX farnesyltransferase
MERTLSKPVDRNLTINTSSHIMFGGQNFIPIHDAQTPSSPLHTIVECPIEESVSNVVEINLGKVVPVPTRSLKELIRCYRELWKSNLSGLVVFTAGGAYYACGGTNWKEAATLCTGTFLQAACANSLNEIIEVERDKIMTRTKNRPLPTGRISKTHAILQAMVVGVGGTYLLYKFNNPMTAVLGAANIILYAGVYTPLKVKSILNTWVGTLNGSLPPLMGSAAATTGRLTDPVGLFLFGVMYLWQIPHFMAINYKCKSGMLRSQ